MSRPTRLTIDTTALVHNINKVRLLAPNKSIIAMVKANAYGCGIPKVLSVFEDRIDTFGVACLEEAMQIRRLGSRTTCLLFQGVFHADEWQQAERHHFQVVIHQKEQLQSLLATPLATPIHVWVKVNTGMSRLGFPASDITAVLSALQSCAWVKKPLGFMTHFACADEPNNPFNQYQWQNFQNILRESTLIKGSLSTSNSAAIIALPEMQCDAVRPGIMLYGASPFSHITGTELGLRPVMQLTSCISAIHHLPAHTPVGYGCTWSSSKSSVIGVVPVGYADGYPRVIQSNTPVWIRGQKVPIVGRVSMDMMTVDLTQVIKNTKNCGDITVGEPVELWGKHIPIEHIAQSAGTICYEIMTHISDRVR